MRVIYSKDYNAPFITAVPLAAAAAVTTIRTESVTGYALVNCAFAGGVTVAASTDGFATTVYSHVINPVSANIIVDLTATPVVAATWRLTAGSGGGTYGILYPGHLATLQDPAYPYLGEMLNSGSDVTTLGGVDYARAYYAAWRAEMSWSTVRETDLALWRPWFHDSHGFRRPFVVEEPLGAGLALHVATAPASTFPLSRVDYHLNGGKMVFKAVQGG